MLRECYAGDRNYCPAPLDSQIVFATAEAMDQEGESLPPLINSGETGRAPALAGTNEANRDMGLMATFTTRQSDHQRGWQGLLAGNARCDQCCVVFGRVSARHLLFPRHWEHTECPFAGAIAEIPGDGLSFRPSVGLIVAGLASRGRAKAGEYYDAGSVISNRSST